ncbi:hypothetical protein FYJ24_03475 [Actinomycetaceae bacterium WB03_NA08]|uniref:Uncharacterized protein n=1 Tax=Scrofimicrobium canadense TaxID=2652290 RepID=A0A6N7W3G4_9ACTO|nr:hypothetical protein [Scrofimicrobium canadense]MSS83835.1 hypothetical protein [Scrofimicrobium canadense]
MRIFLPLKASELCDVRPPRRDGMCPLENSDDAAEEALYEAAFASMELSFAEGVLPVRVVAVGEGPLTTWDDVESFHVESERGIAIARRMLHIEDQEVLDAAVEEIFEQPLHWYDVTELPLLRSVLGSCDS